MANYVSHRVICSTEIFEKFFLDLNPFGEDEGPVSPYITFHKLFDCKTYYDYDSRYIASIYNGFGFYWQKIADNQMEIKFCTRWQYPIEVIIKALELCKEELVWYACEENHIYVSRFCWRNGKIEEHILPLGDEYYDWDIENEQKLEAVMADRDCDDSVWYFLPISCGEWKIWPSEDSFSRYDGVPVVHIKKTEWSKLDTVEK